ncbi:hypothetical protein LMH87_004205 [Akanthomyces muscarius]|uniref:Uncharacterized protein n=1 Tax=Akanthomyces muscarius TaxID=2231603 RepID=A0A9W8Q564_AKAMU|nr:hypothetical protein LMH87_004205 [Akanthomyces muscarius]KAJ4145352.1 hypothetical protein LMH87_004205 [Akanthomyces muscarius]
MYRKDQFEGSNLNPAWLTRFTILNAAPCIACFEIHPETLGDLLPIYLYRHRELPLSESHPAGFPSHGSGEKNCLGQRKTQFASCHCTFV